MSRQKCCDQISLDEIRDATDDYLDETNVLGHRGARKVYVAEIRLDGKMTQVSVKHSNSNSHEEFEKEIKTVSMIQHPNLVSLFGYCDESDQRILLFEHMEKGSLSSYVMEKSSISLSWQQRLRICLGAARGLQYLHSETDEFPKGIIHRDVKLENILLDKNWVAKIWGFEMFMLSHIGQIQSTMSTNLKGTVGYYAPEYIISITRKMDVYAFGVVLLQVLCLKMPWDWEDDYYSIDNEDLGIWAQQNVDTRIKEEICDDSLMAYTVIVEKCLKTDPKKRPTMDGVVLDLENVLRVSDQQSTGFLPKASRLPRQKYFDRISLGEIKEATNNFDHRNVLGNGGTGTVYLAEIRLGGKRTQVAVKQLKPWNSAEEFEREIMTISKIQHPNIVSLVGYCDESDEKIVLSEFMEKGSLFSYLKKKSSFSLSWQQRLRICLGAARGLQHLHAETDEFPKGIIHRNVKPRNILLDKNWVAKITGFEIIKLSHVGQIQSTMITELKGTSGYYAPEYMRYMSITRKIDVYAFGVVLFQVLCLKMPWERGDESYYSTEDEDYGIWAQQNVDTRIKEEICDDSLKAFTAIVDKSLKMDPSKRATMDEVVLDLENALKCQEREDEAKQLRGARESDEQ